MKKKNNLLTFVIIVLLIGALFVSIVSKGFTNMDASTWFGKNPDDNPETKEEVLAVDEKGNKLYASGNYSMPKGMTFLSTRASTAADDGILITAKFTPENATKTELKWSVDWKYDGVTEEQNMWAGDCEQTLDQIIQLTTTAKACRVNCLQEFGCPIVLKCESVSNPSAYATCQLDFAKRITNYTPKFVNATDNVISYTNDTLNWDFNKEAYLGFYNDYTSDAEKTADRDTWFTYGVGTVKDTYSMSYTITLDSDVSYDLDTPVHNAAGIGTQSKTYEGDVSLNLNTSFMHNIFGYSPAEGQSEEEFMQDVIGYIAVDSTTGSHIFDLTIRFQGTYSTFEKTFKVEVSTWNYDILIDAIELTKPNLTF